MVCNLLLYSASICRKFYPLFAQMQTPFTRVREVLTQFRLAHFAKNAKKWGAIVHSPIRLRFRGPVRGRQRTSRGDLSRWIRGRIPLLAEFLPPDPERTCSY